MGRTLVQSDDFADNNLNAGAVNWTQLNDASYIQNTNGNVSSVHTGESVGRVNGTYTNDQYAKVKILTLPLVSTSGGIGVVARSSADVGAGRDYYKYWIDGSTGSLTTRVTRVNNGSPTHLNSVTSVTWSVNDTIEIEVEGSVVRGYQNGTLRVTYDDSAAPLTTGKPGVMVWNQTAVGDDWEGGNVTAAAVPDTPITPGTMRKLG